jgi:hypothetical protein
MLENRQIEQSAVFSQPQPTTCMRCHGSICGNWCISVLSFTRDLWVVLPAFSSGVPLPYREHILIWPWTFFLFTWSAAAYGPSFTLFITWVTEKITKQKTG